MDADPEERINRRACKPADQLRLPGEGPSVRLLALNLAMFCLCLGPAGCSLFDKNKSASGSSGGKGLARDAEKKDDPLFGGSSRNNTATAPPATPASSTNSILAGRVVGFHERHGFDGGESRFSNTTIRLIPVQDKEPANPIEVAVHSDGYFIIEKVKPGVEYKLMARAKRGDRVVAGITYAIAPDSRINIRLSEDFADDKTPSVPGPPSVHGKQPHHNKTSSNPPETDGASPIGSVAVPTPVARQDPTPTSVPFSRQPMAGQDDGNELGVTIKVPGPTPPTTAGVVPSPVPSGPPSSPEWSPPPLPATPPTSIGAAPSPKWPPPATIPPPTNKPSDEFKMPVPPPSPPPLPAADPGEPPPPNLRDLKVPTGREEASANPAPLPSYPLPSPVPDPLPARVPSCQVDNGRLSNFALYDVNLTTWEYRQRTGKLVLLDFWGTWCPPCVESIPRLCEVKKRYGFSGLEVIGIACERDSKIQDKAHRVNNLCHKLFVNYRQLLSLDSDCPVRRQFNVQRFPTMILLDENGEVIWRHEGMLNPGVQDQLERILQHHLNRAP